MMMAISNSPQQNSYSTSPFLFLNLPRELRDRVYFQVLLSPITPASTSPDEAGPRQEFRISLWNPESAISYDSTFPRSSTSALLCASHQIHDETHAAIVSYNKVHPEGLTYHLDCMIRGDAFGPGGGLWPTWVSLPAPVRYVRYVKVDIRCFGDLKLIRFIGVPGVRLSIDIRSRLLLRLLWQFFANGHGFSTANPSFQQSPQLFMNTLDSLTVKYVPRPGTHQGSSFLEDLSLYDYMWGSDLEALSLVLCQDLAEACLMHRLKKTVQKLIDWKFLSGRVRRLRLIVLEGATHDENIDAEIGEQIAWETTLEDADEDKVWGFRLREPGARGPVKIRERSFWF